MLGATNMPGSTGEGAEPTNIFDAESGLVGPFAQMPPFHDPVSASK